MVARIPHSGVSVFIGESLDNQVTHRVITRVQEPASGAIGGHTTCEVKDKSIKWRGNWGVWNDYTVRSLLSMPSDHFDPSYNNAILENSKAVNSATLPAARRQRYPPAANSQVKEFYRS